MLKASLSNDLEVQEARYNHLPLLQLVLCPITKTTTTTITTTITIANITMCRDWELITVEDIKWCMLGVVEEGGH